MRPVRSAAGTPAVGRRGAGGRLAILAGFVCALLLMLPAPTASAHAFLIGSTPADGQTLVTAPTEIRLQFSESVVLNAMSLDIVDSAGRHFRPSSLRVQRGQDTEDPVEVIAMIPLLGRDAYRMSWETLSSDDLHRTTGLLVFGISTTVKAVGSVEPTPPLLEVLLRIGIFLSLSAALGGLLSSRLLRTSGTSSDALIGRSRLSAAWGAGSGVIFGFALFTDQVLQRWYSPQELLFSSFGLHFALREVGFGLLLTASLWPLSSGRIAPRRALIAVGSLAIGIDTALMGHSAAGAAASVTRIAAETAHLLAASTWSGVLLLVMVVILPSARRSGVSITPVLRTFGVPAAACVAVMVVTGLYLASGVIGSVDALILTFYGRTFLFKLVFVAVVSVLGAVNHHRLRRRDRRGSPVRTLAVEAAAAGVILALAGILTSSQPAMEPQYVRDRVTTVVPVRDAAAADLQETLAIRTNVPGRNVLVARVFDTRRPAPAPIRRVLMTMVDPGGVPEPAIPAVPIGDGAWSASMDIEWTQPFSVRLTVQRPGMPDTVESYPWVLAAPSGSRREAVISDAPVGDLLRLASAVSFGVAGVAGAVLVVRRRQRRIATLYGRAADSAAVQRADPPPGSPQHEAMQVLTATRGEP